MKKRYMIIIFVLLLVAMIALYKYITYPYYKSEVENGLDEEDFIDYSNIFSSLDGSNLEEVEGHEADLVLDEYYTHISFPNNHQTEIRSGVVLKNAGDAPILIDEIETKFQSLEKEIQEQEDVIFLEQDSSPNRAIYPGETFNYNYERTLDNDAWDQLETDLSAEGPSEVEVVFDVDFQIHRNDIKQVDKGKKLDENPYQVVYEANNIEASEAEEQTVVEGEVHKKEEDDDAYFSSYRSLSVKFYDGSDKLHYIEKADIDGDADTIDLGEVEFEYIPDNLIFDTPPEDLGVKIEVFADIH